MFNPIFDSIALATNRPVDQSARLLTPEEQSADLEAITADSAALLSPVQQSSANRLGSWRPTDLSTDLLAWWDAEDLTAGAVSSWVDRVANRNAAQAIGATQPVKGAWGVAFDGSNDELTLASQPFPSAANPVEIWALVNQTALPADTGGRTIVSYGGTTNATMRRLVRNVASGVNRLQLTVGDGSTVVSNTFASVDLSGRQVVRGVVTATSISTAVGGSSLNTATSVIPSTGTTRVRIGATTLATPNLYYQGDIAVVIFTNLLSATNAARMAAYLMARR